MKRFLTIICAMCAIVSIYAQETSNVESIAVLNHAGTLTEYYGPDNALSAAITDAVDGDVISLSPGPFTIHDYTINKSLVIRGCGYDNEKAKTSVNQWNLYFEAESMINVTFEGIEILGGEWLHIRRNTSLYFDKCSVSSEIHSEGNENNTCTISRSIISALCFSSGKSFVSNSVVCYPEGGSIMDHCIVYDHRANNFYNNSIIISIGHRETSSTNTHNNCVAYYEFDSDGEPDNYFGDESNNNKNISGLSIFANPEGIKDFVFDRTDYSLTSAAQTTYLGDDGTQVGIYGGDEPYTTAMSYPVIEKFQVDRKSTTDGKLGVSIDVKMPE